MPRRKEAMLRPATLAAALALAGCFAPTVPDAPIPTRLLEAPQAGPAGERTLAIVLPGRGDSLAGLARSGIAEAIQRAAPQVSVQLAGATMGYYVDGGLAARLHEQLVLPARAQGYRRIWLAGASMGGMGALIYEREHPGEVDRLLLLAPYLGEPALIEEIAAAGTLERWSPGPVAAAIDADTIGRELWRMIRGWSARPDLAARVWLVCGRDDRLLPASRLLATQLPPRQFLERDGGHLWRVWSPAAGEVLARAGAAPRADTRSSP